MKALPLGPFPLSAFTLLAAASLSGCATPTTIQSSWVDPTFDRGPFHRVAVVALFDTDSEIRSFEQQATRALEEKGTDAVAAYTIVGDERRLERDELRAKLADANVDAILIYRLIAVDERQYYRPPTPYLRMPGDAIRGDPFYWYYYPRPDYYSFWRSTWDVPHSPEYWQSHSFVVVESSFYDAAKDRLVWTAKTETMDDTQFNATIESIVRRVTKQLVGLRAVGPSRDDRTADSR
jgi:hypothetical protein